MKTKSGLVRIALLAVAGGFGWSAAPAAAGEDTLEIEVRLLGALGAGGDTSLPALLLDLTRTGDRWERVWGVHSDNRKPALYAGCVRKAEVGGDRVTFAIQMWHRDLSGIEMDLRRAADGELQGTYTVNVGTNAVKGRADGRIKPKRPALPAGVAPAKPGERPRILVRASEIPALKKKIETPAGKAAFEKMGDEKTADAIGQGLKYALTGDKEYADKAMVFAEKNMTGNPGDFSAASSTGTVAGDQPAAYVQVGTQWFALFRKEGRWVVGADPVDLNAVWAGSAAMLAECVKYVLADPRADVPIAAGMKFTGDELLGNIPGKVGRIDVLDAGKVVKLRKGLYPMLVALRLNGVTWATIDPSPRPQGPEVRSAVR